MLAHAEAVVDLLRTRDAPEGWKIDEVAAERALHTFGNRQPTGRMMKNCAKLQ